MRDLIRLLALTTTIALGACSQNQRPKVADPGVTLDNVQSARACATVAQDLEVTGDYPGAIMYYEKARELDPVAYQWVAYPLALMHAWNGDEVRADIEFRRAWRLSPNDPAILAAWNAQ